MTFLLATLLAMPLATAVPPTPGVPADRSTPHAGVNAGNDAVTARTRALFHQLQKNTVDHKLLTPHFAAELDDGVTANLAHTLAALGEPGSFVARKVDHVARVTTYDYDVTFPAGTLTITIGIDDASDLIARYYVRRLASSPH